ncbi:MAG: hypothetical protein ACYCS7_15225 [Acidimicrobiales bacterium]
MRWFALPRRIGLAGVLAGSVLLAGGGGLGVVALASSQSAGALSAQLPAVGVREQNVNAAGRIRVALPSTGVGVNGNVSVSNLPTNAAGRVKTQNGTGTSGFSAQNAMSVPAGQTVTLASVSGSGRFVGVDLGTAGYSSNASIALVVQLDGAQVMADGIASPACCGLGAPGIWGSEGNGTGAYFFPPGGLPFHKSLVVLAVNYGSANASAFPRVWYTTGG